MKQTEGDDWPRRWTEAIGQQLQRLRGQRGLSARELSERTAALGYAVPRNTITNLENGRKTTVSVAEAAVLAAALDIAPVLLLYSMASESVERLPGEYVAPVMAVEWFGSNLALSDFDPSRPNDGLYGLRELDMLADVYALQVGRQFLQARSMWNMLAAEAREADDQFTEGMTAAQRAEYERAGRAQTDALLRTLRAATKEASRLGVALPTVSTADTDTDDEGEK